jgi:hypothetical protein
MGCLPGADGVLVIGIGPVGFGILGTSTGAVPFGRRYSGGFFLNITITSTIPVKEPYSVLLVCDRATGMNAGTKFKARLKKAVIAYLLYFISNYSY